MATSRNADAPAAVHFSFAVAPSQPLSNSLRSNLALSPDGRTLVYATIDSTGVRRLFRRALDDLEPQSITGTEGAQSPFVSPDGKKVGFLVGGNLMKIPIDGGTPQLLAKVDNAHGAAWGPRGVVAAVNGRLAMIPAGGGTPCLVTSADSAVPGFWPVFRPGGDVVVYATEPGLATTTLSAVDVRSGHVTPLGLSGRGALGMSRSELLFVRQDLAVMAAPFDVGAVRVIGRARAIVPRIQGYAPAGEIKAALPPSGTLAYVTGSDGFRMVTVDLRGVQRPTAVPAGPHAFPRYSPDGRRIASEKQASGQTDIFIHDVTSGAERRLTTEGTDNARPEWSADGTRIVYRSGRPGSYHSLWSRRADGSGAPVQLLAVPGKPVWEGQLTPDGKMVVYRVGLGTNGDIFYQRLDGDRTPVAIAATGFKENGVRVSPDGRWVAYASDESGIEQVYVRPFPGPGAAVPVSLAGGATTVWSRDGRTLFYADRSHVVAATIAANPLFTVVERTSLFENHTLGSGDADYDLAPDGKSLLLLLPVESVREEIVVMHNWASEPPAPASRGRPK